MNRPGLVLGLVLCLTLGGVSPAHAGSGDTTTGLVGHWTFDDGSGSTAADSAGSNDGTLINMEESDWVDGVIGQALNMDGVNEEVTLPSPITGAPNAVPFTISLWTYWKSGPASLIRDNTSSSGTLIGWDDLGVLKFRVGGAGFNTGENPDDYQNKWVHWVLVNDTATATLYANGVQIGQVAPGTDTIASPWHVLKNGTHTSLIEGMADDVRMYNRALTPDDITALYQRSDRYCDNPTDAPGIIRYNTDRSALQYCDGKKWVMMGTGSYTPVAVHFQSADINTTTPMPGVSDSRRVSGSFWFRRTGDFSSYEHVFAYENNGLDIYFEQPNNNLTIRGRDSSGGGKINLDTSDFLTDSDWHHILFSADITAGVEACHLYVDGVADKIETSCAESGKAMDFTSAGNLYIGANDTGSNEFDGSLADLWLDFGTYIDFSSAALREKFVSPTGMPMYLGADGSLPTGKAPDIFLSGDVDDWHTNKGSGGGFAENGALTYASAQMYPSVGLAGHWKLDEASGTTAVDSAGGNDGTMQGGLHASANSFPGKLGKALSFDGNNDYVSVANNAALNPTSAITVTAWVKRSSNGSRDFIVSKGKSAGGGDHQYWLEFTAANELVFLLEDGSGAVHKLTAADTTFTDNSWHHIAATYDGNIQKIYVDGVADSATISWTDSIDTTADDLVLGNRSFYYNIPYGGLIDDVRIYERALTVDEIQALYNNVACVGPAGQPSTLIYNTDHKVMQYCNGRDWVAMSKGGSTGGGGCASPAGVTGEMIYNADYKVMQYCNSEDWVAIGKDPEDPCAGSPSPGDLCADGSVYAGLSPDGNVKMYVTRCDTGQTWDGSNCTGTRLSLPWNDGDTNYVETSYTSAITGETNTSGIAAIDSNNVTGGFQDHVAAVYCNDLSQDGYTDWYLPAKEELNVIYGNKDVIGQFNTGGSWYWSSTESDISDAWTQRFSTDNQFSLIKYNTRLVRCVRR